MQNRISVLVALSVAIVLIAVSAQPGDAQTNQVKAKSGSANECLSRPQGAAPNGKHWWYRLDRRSGRRCWYLGAEKSAAQKSATHKTAQTQRKARARVLAQRKAPAAEEVSVENPTPAVVATTVQPPALASMPPAVPEPKPVAALERTFAPAPESEDREAVAILAAQEEMPLVWPVLAETAATAGQRSDAPAPSLGQLLMFVLTAAAFLAVAIHTIVKLLDVFVGRRRHRPSAPSESDRELEFAPAPPIQAAPLPYDVPRFLVAPRGHGNARDLSRRRVWTAEADTPAPRRRAVA